MLTIVGGGLGTGEYLTQAAVAALDQAEVIFVEPTVREALGVDERWLSKVSGPFAEDTPTASVNFSERDVVWMVPGTPALYPPVAEWVSEQDSQVWQYIRIVSGIPALSAQLDAEGIFLPPVAVSLHSLTDDTHLEWRDNQWDGQVKPVRWRQARPLHGRQVVLLRSSARISRAVRWLENWGAEVMLCPVSRLTDPESWEPVDRCIRRLERYDWVIFTSAESAARWFTRMRRLGVDVRHMRARIAVVGPETAVRIREWGLVPELMPSAEYSQEGLASAFREVPLRGQVVLFPGGDLNREVLGEELRGRGALVDEVVLYQNRPEPLPLSLHQAIRTESCAAILFTASSQVEYLLDQLIPEDRRHLAAVPAFSIGPLTTRTLNHYGIRPMAEPSEPSLRLLVEAVRGYYAQERPGD